MTSIPNSAKRVRRQRRDVVSSSGTANGSASNWRDEYGRPLSHLSLVTSTAPETDWDEEASSPPITVAGVAKRAFDVVAATAGLIVLAPLVAAVAFAIKIDSPGPVLFAHRRLGRRGRPFGCLKFRSMRDDAEQILHADERLRHEYVSNHFKIPAECDPRITALGRLLRRSSLDEIPQLFNVLRGEMSLVGPRPIVPLEATHYGEDVDVLLSVRPGLTGAWAVRGRSAVGYPQRAALELSYVRDWSIRGDVRILLRTPWAVISQRGAL